MAGADLAFSNALGEVTLAVFTSIAPSAVFAVLALLVPLSFGRVSEGAWYTFFTQKIDYWIQ